ncbi:hypothetical protein SteCoe_14300 [Stentor coeruleus]|uniref:Uncharacterized protein n=1 Tax=Stentor coeruleus TaxID=5963 RepID=A0A1R2C6F9_9CILI|nr:hypothetical protein SteCoe_14300 [Stentor coeruleus]
MGNCFTSKNLYPEADNMKKPIVWTKNQVTVCTFSGPQNYFENIHLEENLTFSDPEFCPHNKSLVSVSISRENSMV